MDEVISITVEPHPLLDLAAFVTALPSPLGEMTLPTELAPLLSPEAGAPVARSDELRGAVRDLLRHGGFKPAGRNKPSAEYLVRAAGDGPLRSINVAVDVCNAVSLHSGLPISVVDLARVRPPFRIAVAAEDSGYVFNPSGQALNTSGLLCLHDADGPCANAVKDAQRAKTDEKTTRTLTLIWGVVSQAGHTAQTEAWYRELLARAGAGTHDVERL